MLPECNVQNRRRLRTKFFRFFINRSDGVLFGGILAKNPRAQPRFCRASTGISVASRYAQDAGYFRTEESGEIPKLCELCRLRLKSSKFSAGFVHSGRLFEERINGKSTSSISKIKGGASSAHLTQHVRITYRRLLPAAAVELCS